MDSQEEQYRVNVHMTQRIWSLRLEVDGAPISWGALASEFQKGCLFTPKCRRS